MRCPIEHPCFWIKHWFQQIVVTWLYYFQPWLKNIHTHQAFLFVLFFNLIRGERFFHWLFTTFILWSIIKIYFKLWITYNFFNFIGKNVHMFHHISILMPPTIQCIIEGTFMTIINEIPFTILSSFYCLYIVLNFYSQAIGILKNQRMETNIWVWNFNDVSTP
jgi:hypothetical protein